jgi:hypothetical protein
MKLKRSIAPDRPDGLSMTNQKETEMNAWKTIALATATLALAAPVANAKFDSSMPSKALHAKVLKHKHVAPKVKTKTSSRVLIIVASLSPSTQITPVDDCAISGVDCTNQQLCDLWAVNCDLVTVTPTVDAATEVQTAGS